MPWQMNIGSNMWQMVPLLLWSLTWKGIALWYAAKRDEKVWFGVLLILNTMGIVEILYLVFRVKLFSKKQVMAKKPHPEKKRS